MFANQPALVALAQQLIRAKSITGNEREAVRLSAQEMHYLGFDHVWVDEVGSLIGIREGVQPGPTLLLDGHCDTVDANAQDWRYDPWGGDIENGRIFGRGAADMKGSLAAMIHAAGSLSSHDLAGRVVVSATVSEEVAEGRALKAVIEEIHPDFVIIGEATRLNLNRGGRGRAEIQITSLGRSAHSSSPAAGRCAVTDMISIIQAIAAHPQAVDPFLGPASMVLTDIISEPYPGHSVIPYRCHVTFDRRLLPGECKADLLQEFSALPGLDDKNFSLNLATLNEITYTGFHLTGEKFFPAWLLPETHFYVQSVLNGLKSTGLNPQIGAYRFCTNAAYSAGVAGIPTIGFGIGCEEDAHIVDESIALDDLMFAASGYQGMIQSICKK